MIRILSWKVLGTVTWSFAPTKQWQGIQFALPSLRTKGRSCFSNLPVPWATWCMDDGNKSMQPFLAQEKYYEGLSAGGIYWSTSVDKRYSRYKCSTKIKSPLRFKTILRTLLKLLFRFLRFLSIWYDLIWFDEFWILEMISGRVILVSQRMLILSLCNGQDAFGQVQGWSRLIVIPTLTGASTEYRKSLGCFAQVVLSMLPKKTSWATLSWFEHNLSLMCFAFDCFWQFRFGEFSSGINKQHCK